MEFKKDYFEMTEEIPSSSEEIKNTVIGFTSSHRCDKIVQVILDNIKDKADEIQDLCDELFKYGRLNIEYQKAMGIPVTEKS